jgi:hypothetical protein
MHLEFAVLRLEWRFPRIMQSRAAERKLLDLPFLPPPLWADLLLELGLLQRLLPGGQLHAQHRPVFTSCACHLPLVRK